MRITNYNLEQEPNGRAILVKESAFNIHGTEFFDSPSKVSGFFKDYYGLDRKAEEYVFTIALNTKLKPIGIFQIGHGTSNSCFCPPLEILIRLLFSGASGFIVAHNHPSGDPAPSKEDFEFAECLKEASDIIGIRLYDHIIVAQDDFHSFADSRTF